VARDSAKLVQLGRAEMDLADPEVIRALPKGSHLASHLRDLSGHLRPRLQQRPRRRAHRLHWYDVPQIRSGFLCRACRWASSRPERAKFE